MRDAKITYTTAQLDTMNCFTECSGYTTASHLVSKEPGLMVASAREEESMCEPVLEEAVPWGALAVAAPTGGVVVDT